MERARTRTFELTLRNELADMAQLRDAVDRCAAELALPAKALFQLQVALDELVSNVIRYAWLPGGSHQFLVRVTLEPNTAKVEVVDDGVSFDPRSAPAAQPPPGGKLSVGGRGIAMLRSLVDRIDYARIGNRNHTTLHKHW